MFDDMNTTSVSVTTHRVGRTVEQDRKQLLRWISISTPKNKIWTEDQSREIVERMMYRTKRKIIGSTKVNCEIPSFQWVKN